MNSLLNELQIVPSRALDAYLSANVPPEGPIRLTGYPVVAGYPQWLIEAAEDAVRRPSLAPPAGIIALRHAVARYVSRQIGQDLSHDNVLITAGAMQAIAITWLVLTDEGDQVVVPAPNYFVDGSLSLVGRGTCHVPVPGNVFLTEALDQHLSEHPDRRHSVIYHSNPNNPTGRVMRQSDWDAILELAARHEIPYVVFDESYASMVWDGSLDFKTTIDHGPTTFVRIGSFSKAFSMPWLRCGWLVADAGIIADAEKVAGWLSLNGTSVVQSIALAALDGDHAWLNQGRDLILRNRNRVVEGLQQIGSVVVSAPDAGPFVYPRIRSQSSSQLASQATALGIPLVPGPAFGDIDEYVRLPFVGESNSVARALDGMKELLHD